MSCCGKSPYGNIAKAHSKDRHTRYYYYFKNTVGQTGHKCTFQTNMEKRVEELNSQMRKIQVTKIRLEHQMDNLDVADLYYDRKIADLQRRYDDQYDKAGEIEAQTKEFSCQIFNIRQEKISTDNSGTC